MPVYQGPLLPTQNESAFRNYGIDTNQQLYQGPVQQGQNETQFRLTGQDTPTTPPPPKSNDPYAGIDLSNQAKKDDYARRFGYPGWNEYQASLNQSAYTGPSEEELNAAYNPLFDYLNQAENKLRTDYPTYQQEITQQGKTSGELLKNQQQQALGTIRGQQEKGQQQKEDVITQAVRIFNELDTANKQRFGGASSAGQAASELQGRELQRNIGTTEKSYQNLVQELNTKVLETQANFQIAEQQLKDKIDAAMNQVNREYQDKLLEINRQRSELGANKAQARLNAIQEYRSNLFAIDLQKFQFQQQLDAARQQAELELEMYQRQLASTTQSPIAKIKGGNFNTVYAKPQAQQTTPTGAINTGTLPTNRLALANPFEDRNQIFT